MSQWGKRITREYIRDGEQVVETWIEHIDTPAFVPAAKDSPCNFVLLMDRRIEKRAGK